ncbi:hypothetical protein ACA910_000626 [Epithemia clementina (nom. ined.)]
MMFPTSPSALAAQLALFLWLFVVGTNSETRFTLAFTIPEPRQQQQRVAYHCHKHHHRQDRQDRQNEHSRILLLHNHPNNLSCDDPSNMTNHHKSSSKNKVPFPLLNRRNALMIGSATWTAVTTAAATLVSPLLLFGHDHALAVAAETTPAPQNNELLNTLLSQLRAVPTYCLVNSDGAAYMLYRPGRGSKPGFARGYAFLTFSGALAVLADAQRTAEKEGYGEVWKDATITIIPADIAVRLALQPRRRDSQKEGISSNTEVALIPGVEQRDAAVKIDGSFKEQTKVPLFYFDTTTTTTMTTDEEAATRLYFNPTDLFRDWNERNNGGKNMVPPRIQAVDLVTLFEYVVRGREDEVEILQKSLNNNNNNNNNKGKSNIVFVPDSESLEVAEELKRKQGLAPYKTDRMII